MTVLRMRVVSIVRRLRAGRPGVRVAVQASHLSVHLRLHNGSVASPARYRMLYRTGQSGRAVKVSTLFLVSRLRMHGVTFFSKRHYGRRRLNAVGLFLGQGCTNFGLEVAVASAFYTVVPNVCVYSVWNLLRITFLVPRIFYDS